MQAKMTTPSSVPCPKFAKQLVWSQRKDHTTAEATSKQVHSAHSFGYRKWCCNVEARSQRMQCASPVPSLFDVAKLPFFWRSFPE